mgnify:CR=1 FL=1
MEKPIIKDEAFLAQKSQPATFMDIAVAQDLLDTLAAHADRCVGLAANMIGVQKCVIAVNIGPTNIAMLNPEIIKCSGKYMTEEGCLSLTGTRKTRRWQSIKVQYQNEKFQTRLKTFTGWTAQIIQHEIDHCNGIII